MAHLWLKDDSRQWAVFRLGDEAFDVGTNPPAATPGPPAGNARAAAWLLRGRVGAPAGWVLVVDAEARVAVNGLPSLVGIHVLADRDEICVPGAGTFFFSTETLPAIEKFHAGERRIVCPRCKLPIESGNEAVRCPSCGVWHHQLADRPCFTYDEKCAACGSRVDLNGGYRWRPED